MDPVAVSGLFALAGVALAAGFGWMGAAMQRRWTRIDTQQDRQAAFAHDHDKRVFEEKVATYFKFFEEANRLNEAYYAYARGLEGDSTPAPVAGEVDAFFSLLLRLQIYGSPTCVRLGSSVYASVVGLVHGGRGASLDDNGAREALNAYLASVREDLGVGNI